MSATQRASGAFKFPSCLLVWFRTTGEFNVYLNRKIEVQEGKTEQRRLVTCHSVVLEHKPDELKHGGLHSQSRLCY